MSDDDHYIPPTLKEYDWFCDYSREEHIAFTKKLLETRGDIPMVIRMLESVKRSIEQNESKGAEDKLDCVIEWLKTKETK